MQRSLLRFAPWLIACTLLVAVVGPAEARPRVRRAARFSANKTFGLGIMLGAPSGLSGKYYLGADTAIDFGLGVYHRYRYHSALHAHVDFLWHPVVLATADPFVLPLYLGIGGRFIQHGAYKDEYDEDSHLGVRAPLGVLMDFNRVPIDIFFELALVFDFLVNDDRGYLDVNGAIGARYYF